MAEYFRDHERRPVLLFIDNIFRYIQAGAEVSALLGRLPSAVGYQPTLESEMGELQERITTTSRGSVTSIQAVYVPADDLTDPAVVATFAHLDASTVLSRRQASMGFYPAIDPLESSSSLLTPMGVGEEHYHIAAQVRALLARYRELQDVIAILGIEELSDEDRLVEVFWNAGGGRAFDRGPTILLGEDPFGGSAPRAGRGPEPLGRRLPPAPARPLGHGLPGRHRVVRRRGYRRGRLRVCLLYTSPSPRD